MFWQDNDFTYTAPEHRGDLIPGTQAIIGDKLSQLWREAMPIMSDRLAYTAAQEQAKLPPVELRIWRQNRTAEDPMCGAGHAWPKSFNWSSKDGTVARDHAAETKHLRAAVAHLKEVLDGHDRDRKMFGLKVREAQEVVPRDVKDHGRYVVPADRDVAARGWSRGRSIKGQRLLEAGKEIERVHDTASRAVLRELGDVGLHPAPGRPLIDESIVPTLQEVATWAPREDDAA